MIKRVGNFWIKGFVSAFLIYSIASFPVLGHASSPNSNALETTLESRLSALTQTLAESGEIGWVFNRWKYEYNTAMKMGENGLVATRQYQAIQVMTIGKRGNYKENFERMKENKFLSALANGDAYDYGLDAVAYLAKDYKRSDGEILNEKGEVLGVFCSDGDTIQWGIYDYDGLAKELGVTPQLISAWNDALSAYDERKIVYRQPK